MNAKFFTPIKGETLKDLLKNLNYIQDHSRFIEIRADYLKKIQIEDLLTIRKATHSKAIFTFRQKRFGGEFDGRREDWKSFLEVAIGLDFEYVDIEFPENNYLDLNKKSTRTKIILSVHDFHRTPGYRAMRSIQKRMRGYKAYIQKFAYTPQTDGDLENLVRLLVSRKKTDKMCVIGMGQKGKFLRLIAPYLGNYLNFFSNEDFKTAPGQLTIEEFNRFQNYVSKLIN